MESDLVSIGQTARQLGVSIDTLRRWDKSGKFVSVRIGSRGNRYYRRSDIALFLNDQKAVALKWASSPIGYEPEPEYFCKTRDIFQARLEGFQSNLIKNLDPNFASLVTAVVGEIGNNSFDHNLGNWPDILGVYFSYSLSLKQIVLADRGLGILATLKRAVPNLTRHEEALETAFTKIISGRAPESRGNGLKFVKNIVTKNPFSLLFQSGNAILSLKENTTNIKIEEADSYIRGCLAIIGYYK